MSVRSYYPKISERQRLILSIVMENYILTAKLVGSKYISNFPGLNISSATVRNELAELEEMGLLFQPHTSAGRIPTEKGYAYYVDSMMEETELPSRHRKTIDSILEEQKTTNLENMLEQVSVVLSRVSALISVVLAPKYSKGILHRIDLSKLSSDRILVVLTLKTGVVRTIMLDVRSDLTPEELNRATIFLNQRLSGVKLSDVQTRICEMLSPLDPDIHPMIIQTMIDSAGFVFDHSSVSVFVGEKHHVLDQPEFSDVNSTRAFLTFIENQEEVTKRLQLSGHEPVKGIRIAIGRELGEGEAGYSMVASEYSIGNLEGNIGVFGPTRMNYSLLTSLVNYTVSALKHHHAAL